MTFVPANSGRWAHFDGIDWAGESVVVAGLGYDDARNVSYSMVVGLSPAAGGELEFFFYVVEDDADTGQARELWSGQDVGRLIPHEHRALALATALHSARMVVQHVAPPSFTYTVHDENSPQAAFVKHEAMHRVFEDLEYDIEVIGVRYGKHAWRMTRDQP